jgi:magnesium chelatase family protein
VNWLLSSHLLDRHCCIDFAEFKKSKLKKGMCWVIRVKSFVYLEGIFQSVEIEVISQKGLPSLQFVGLPDQVIKESAIRIKSAIRSAGFDWPQAKQIIVNLKPSHLKKTSRGLEFAVATGILRETQQLPTVRFNAENTVFYGALDLEGNVFLPEDFKIYGESNNERLCTGKVPNDFWCEDYFFQVNSLRDLFNPIRIGTKKQVWEVERPKDFNSYYLTAKQKELLQICALGDHHLLMLGPAGSGKTLMADVIHSLRKPLSKSEQTIIFSNLVSCNSNGDSGELLQKIWRPLVKPHHSITLQGLIGGGIALNEGELSRAHLGTLVFDELLEFKPPVVEALREPLETGKARVARSSGVAIFESQFLWVATSNLCPCGDYIPGKPANCRYSLNRCRSYGQKLSGPLVDRFDLIGFANEWQGERAFSVEQISEELNELWAFTGKPVDTENLPFVVKRMMANWDGSYRRKKATLRVASTIARLNRRSLITEADVEKAFNYTVRPFTSLQRWD